jgi:cellulose synthase/poly-beta-1,6-N-acetylglucosamine synthase-like glycosyltransferase
MILFYLTIGLFFIYSIIILYYRVGWFKTPVFEPTQVNPHTRISVVIAARDEEENIGRLLNSIHAQSYPNHLFEVIVVDDHSSDKTADIVRSCSFVKLINLEFENINSYKKKAIETGIAAATGELIVTTDADCVVPVHWLKTIAAFYEEKKAVFIAAPVKFESNDSLLQVFQLLDFLMLQGITAASVQRKIHNMCNGANLAYERKSFYEVNGFTGIDNIASGDDMLLMQKIDRCFPGKIFYLLSEETIVTTKPVKTLKEFFSQRIRWASKATHYNDIKIFSVLLLVYFFNLALLALFIAGFWLQRLWLGFAGLIIAKTFIEFIFIYPVAKFFSELRLLKFFLFFQPLHIVYTVIAGWLGRFGSFEWKGRRVK